MFSLCPGEGPTNLVPVRIRVLSVRRIQPHMYPCNSAPSDAWTSWVWRWNSYLLSCPIPMVSPVQKFFCFSLFVSKWNRSTTDRDPSFSMFWIPRCDRKNPITTIVVIGIFGLLSDRKQKSRPDYSQNSRLLTSSLFLGVTVPHKPSVSEEYRFLSFVF